MKRTDSGLHTNPIERQPRRSGRNVIRYSGLRIPAAAQSVRLFRKSNLSLRCGFTLIELLTVSVVIGLLVTIVFAGVGDLRTRMGEVECAVRLRGLSHAILLYATENRGRFPQSSHSGRSWALAVAPYLGEPVLSDPLQYRNHKLFVCPLHPEANTDTPACWSYGLNVFFELSAELRYTPLGLPILGSRDNYPGSPDTWHRMADIPSPSRTILLAENPHPVADHFMAHQWRSVGTARNAVAADRHRGKSNYAFVDGHVEMLPIEKTFDPGQDINLWHPALAR